jgi:hypothetical protein
MWVLVEKATIIGNTAIIYSYQSPSPLAQFIKYGQTPLQFFCYEAQSLRFWIIHSKEINSLKASKGSFQKKELNLSKHIRKKHLHLNSIITS